MKPWTTDELRVLKAYAGLGADAVAILLERSPQAVRWAATVNNISLQRTHDDVAINALTTDTLARVRETPALSICPMCGRRFARMKDSGLCRCCHIDLLLEVHAERLEEDIRAKRLDKARQDRRRLRVCERCGADFYPRPSSSDTTCRECGR